MEDLITAAKSLADPTRLRILRILGRGPFTVNEIVSVLATGQSRVSHHLRILADAGMVEGRRDGPRVYYSLARNGTGAGAPRRMLAWLKGELAGRPDGDAAGVAACLDQRADRPRKVFRRHAGQWDRLHRRLIGPPSEYFPHLLDALGSPTRVVDLGTGTGVALGHLAPRVDALIGVDAAPEMLERARMTLERAGLDNVELRLGTLEHLPLGDGEVDGALFNMVLHHVEHPLAALLEARRVLVAGGRLVVVELGAHDGATLHELLETPWPGFEPGTLGRWLEEAGFDAEPARTLPGSPGNDGEPRPPILLIRATAR